MVRYVAESSWMVRYVAESSWMVRYVAESSWMVRYVAESSWMVRYVAESSWMVRYVAESSWMVRYVADDGKFGTPLVHPCQDLLAMIDTFSVDCTRSFIPAVSLAPFQVHYYSEALPTRHTYCVGSFTP